MQWSKVAQRTRQRWRGALWYYRRSRARQTKCQPYFPIHAIWKGISWELQEEPKRGFQIIFQKIGETRRAWYLWHEEERVEGHAGQSNPAIENHMHNSKFKWTEEIRIPQRWDRCAGDWWGLPIKRARVAYSIPTWPQKSYNGRRPKATAIDCCGT